MQFVRPYKWRFIVSSIVRLTSDLVWLFPAYAFASVVNLLTAYKPGDSLESVWWVLALWAGAAVYRSIAQFVAKFYGFGVAEKVAIDATLKGTEHMFQLDMEWHEKENSGSKLKRIQNGALGLNTIIRTWFGILIEVSVNLIFINVIISRFDLNVTLLIILFLVTFFIIAQIFGKKGGQAANAVNAQDEVVNGLLFEGINNIRTVKVMDMAKAIYRSMLGDTDRLFRRLKTRIRWYQSRRSVLLFWSAGFKTAIIAIIVYGFLNGHYEIGFLILFNSYFSDLRGALDELSEATQDLTSSKFSVARMMLMLKQPIRIESEKGKQNLPENWKTIAFKNTSFSYHDHKVLDNVTFEVNRGERVGIVGLSGAGKSTLFKLLLKEREGFSGQILFDNVPIEKIKKHNYFKSVSVVLQDTEVFNMSLRDNITITNASQGRNRKLLEKAIATSHISDVIKKLPEGLDTLIGEKGVKLSGGERQRLGIARAIFKEPQLLLLDEATSHLDLESEEKIQDSLHEFFEETTAIVIAHRLTTIKEMDKILVLERGNVVESGNFAALYAKQGRFFELWEKQRL